MGGVNYFQFSLEGAHGGTCLAHKSRGHFRIQILNCEGGGTPEYVRDADIILSLKMSQHMLPESLLKTYSSPLHPGWSRSAVADELGYPTPFPSPS